MTSPRLNRDDLQRLADIRLAEARTLLDSGHYPGAYYLTGYAVECALKACIAKQVREFDFPDLRRVRSSYHHDFRILLETAGLRDEFRLETVSNPALSENWDIIAGEHGWNTDSRYMPSISERQRPEIVFCRGQRNCGDVVLDQKKVVAKLCYTPTY